MLILLTDIRRGSVLLNRHSVKTVSLRLSIHNRHNFVEHMLILVVNLLDLLVSPLYSTLVQMVKLFGLFLV